MKMRLLSTRKDRKGREWVVMEDSVTGKEEPRHYSVDSFNHHDKVYPYFFKRNNNLVRVATQWGVDLGEDYERFFQQGLRVSQQISVPTKGVGKVDEEDFLEGPKTYADICEKDYLERAKALEERLLGEVKQAKKRRRNEQYDFMLSFLEESASQEESQSAIDLVACLKGTDIREPSSRFGEPSFEEKANYLKEDKNAELLKVLPNVDASIRPLFFHVARYAELKCHGDNWFDYEFDEFSDFLGSIGPENSRLHLESLLMSLEREENIYELRQLIGYSISEIGEEHFEDYFRSVYDTQRMGYEGCTAIALMDIRSKLTEDQRGKYDVVLKKLTDSGFRKFTSSMMNHIAERRPEFLEDPTLVDNAINIYQSKGDEREAYFSILKPVGDK